MLIRLDKEEKDAFQGPSLRIDSEVDPSVGSFLERGYLFPHHMIVRKFLAIRINALSLVSQSIASDHFVLELDVCQFDVSEPGARVSSNTRWL